jgi:hypothetical protein
MLLRKAQHFRNHVLYSKVMETTLFCMLGIGFTPNSGELTEQ